MPSPDNAPSSRSVAVLILGTDAVLYARPMSAARLAESCRRAGYQSVVPASWGDELVAAACIETLAAIAPQPAALCACPLARLSANAAPADVARLSFAAPPVAAARFVRELYGALHVHVAFAGSCPGADHPEIDERITPAQLMERLAKLAGATGARAADGGDLVVHDSERRFRSLPGGAPDARWLTEAGGYTLDAVGELAGPPRALTLYDFAPVGGCACAGASLSATGALPVPPSDARAAVAAGEPARGTAPVIADARASLLARADELDDDGAVASVEDLDDVTVAGARPSARRDAASGRRDVSTLVVPARATRPRRSDGSTRGEGEPIRPHKSSEPLWDGPRRLPLFRIAAACLLVTVVALIYAYRPQPVLPPFAEVERAQASLPPTSLPPASPPVGAAVERFDTRPIVDAPPPDSPTRASPASSAPDSTTLAPALEPPPNAGGRRDRRSAAEAADARDRGARTAPAAARGVPAPVIPPAPDPAVAQAAELRREIEARRARIDSLARSVDSLRAVERQPPRPR